ncbi:MAG: carbohydrate kinase family protein [Candidatus Thermoplasmatota archaeon]|nr:carbohydrate kinase family protein [Candidatus Thermoplasmatota archaeon]MCL5665913.1 carbohydrate kinase family protein [Candidatus Thermoplasmatota archaeon]
MKFLAYFGHMNIDITIGVGRIVTEGTTMASTIRRQFGGTLGNFSIIASKLGLNFHPYTVVSSRSHAAFINYLKSLGTDVSTIETVDTGEGPECYIISDRKEQAAYILQGPMDSWNPSPAILKDTYEYMHFSTGPPIPYMGIASSSRSKITFDPSQEITYKYSPELVKAFTRKCNIIMGNRKEIGIILSILGTSLEKRNTFDVIMTEGATGATGYIGGRKYFVSSVKAEKIYDTVGAGDSFRAGFYTALYRNLSMVDAIISGNIVSSLAISQPITQFNHTWKEIYEMIKEKREVMVH